MEEDLKLGYKYGYKGVVEHRKRLGQIPRTTFQDKGSSTVNEHTSPIGEQCVDSSLQLEDNFDPIQSQFSTETQLHDGATIELAHDENVVLEARTVEEEHTGETIPMVSTSALGDASLQRPPLQREYPATRRALHDRTQSQLDFEEHPENKDVDMDEMIRNYRAKKKRLAKSTK